MISTFVFIAGVAGFLSVALGAFGAHAIRKKVSPEHLAVFQTGVQYQMIHALALMGTGLLSNWSGSLLLPIAGWCFVAGIVLFSGSLYLLSITGNRAFGPITPLGGLCLLAGWALLLIAAYHVV
jgi:uncharacterized membrane protein YgdD (TMEM256/DUF423 family)